MTAKDLSLFLRNKWGINSKPINILNESLENLKNLTILWMPIKKEIKGCCSKNQKDYLIILNSKQNIGNQNFTLAHELYHLLFEKSDEWIICSNDNNSKSEKYANTFASELLLPTASILEYMMKNNIDKWEIEDLIRCEQYYQISHETLTTKLKKLKIEFDSKQINLIQTAKKLGFNTQLYTPSKKYYCLGQYIKLTEQNFKNNKFSIGKRNELLKSVFRSDIIDNY